MANKRLQKYLFSGVIDCNASLVLNNLTQEEIDGINKFIDAINDQNGSYVACYIKTLGEPYYVSGYEDIDFIIDSTKHDVDDVAYCYFHESNKVSSLKILKIIKRSDDISYYDSLPKDALLEGEDELSADLSCEFIIDDDCYLIWFKIDVDKVCNLSRNLAITILKNIPNVKITHIHFDATEYIYSKDDKNVYTEEGYLFEDWYSEGVSKHNGIRDRDFGSWNDGWSIYCN